MASNPPFLVEDQTDEDFFDKLVDDDDEYKVTASSAHSFVDENDSDEVKAFANLSIGEVVTGSEDFEGGTEKKGVATNGDVNTLSVDGRVGESSSLVPSNSLAFNGGAIGTEVISGSTISKSNGSAGFGDFGYGHVEESNSLVSSNSFVFDSAIESSGGATGTEVISDSTITTKNGSAGSGVKEVQWTAFGTDSGQPDSNGFGLYSDFFSELGDGLVEAPVKVEENFDIDPKIGSDGEDLKSNYSDNNYNYLQSQENQTYEAATGQSGEGQDLNSSQYLESLYPGWKYDANTGQWYQVDGYDATGNVQGSVDSNLAGDLAVSDGNPQVSYLQTAQSSVDTVTDSGRTECVTNWNQVSHQSEMTASVDYWNQGSQESGGTESASNWNQVSQGNNEYPAHMVLDPQYPGWYYDTIAQEWRSLETYNSPVQSTIQATDRLSQTGFASAETSSHENDQKANGGYGQVGNYSFQDFSAQNQEPNWIGRNYNQQSSKIWQPENVAKNEASLDFSGSQQLENDYSSNFSVNNNVSQQKSYDSSHNNYFATPGSQGFVPSWDFNQQINQPSMQQNEQMHLSKDYYGNQNALNLSQQQFQSHQQLSYAPNVGRSSAGRPPHALVTFGFGGKLIVMKDSTALNTSSYGSQGPHGGSIAVLNLMEVVTEKTDPSNTGVGAFDYFNTLCRQSFTGPLVGGNVGNKELNKWIDERIANCESPDLDYRKGEVLRLLLSLLKIACQHYGKLRSPFGTESSAMRESDVPEPAVARLFTSAKRNGAQLSGYDTFSHCLQKFPSEGQMRATAAEVQSLLVSGRKKEALHCAIEGQLWGPAIVLAAQLGDQLYVDTVKQMALRQLVAGSPLRTLCLLIAGQPAEVFSSDTSSSSSVYGAAETQYGTNSMLDNWEENLAVITANRTKDDELVLIHLGDCLWKERSEIIAAHICYLVAEANFEPYSDSARLCLIGADHWKFPRTYASPDAIQRTELYEYSKLLGNSQSILLPFQPYKLIYAHMLAEVGKVTESLKYCQAVLKSLKTGRAPEVDTWRKLVSSLEDRIRAHQQGGYSTNLAPAKIVGKLLNLFDSTAHRVVGGLPPPVPSTSQGGAQANGHYQTMGSRVLTSQSTMAMSSLMPSASMEPISEWTADGNRLTMHNRSVSEPDFGRTPRQDQADSSKEATTSSARGKASVSGGASRFGRFNFGSQLLQKTVGLVLKPRQDKQAKLGETNRFYYDEKLKRWVEEGVEPPAEEAALPPPPTTGALQNGMSDYNLNSALKSDWSPHNGSPEFKSPAPSEHNSGIPPMPPASNQFSARGRTGVRSRYVDTFNKGGGNSTNLFQSPSVPSSIKPASGTNPNFFVPAPISSSEQTFDTTIDSVQKPTAITENSPITAANNSFHSPEPPSSMAMQRFPSMDNISNKGTAMYGNGSLSSHSRRTASWSGSFSDAYSPPQRTEVKSLGEVLGMPSEPSLVHLPMNGGSFGDLHEVEL
ncbi:protein transport protein SEC16B homolog [Actinidia eriantha]|uniref:protein transport protein SEC16B homolog n=1 Tax=Actinidia eriantha TaxID=165200 RepID=UPI00258C04C2|nr:protein transport protein SEC16B homolog [Actinidia eriantha]XP_057477865.1 protein transport protein SEC16B homolog [Actinidia eriantha]